LGQVLVPRGLEQEGKSPDGSVGSVLQKMQAAVEKHTRVLITFLATACGYKVPNSKYKDHLSVEFKSDVDELM
jgi:hypothetical protein